jgi:hypothetical protein
VSVTIDLSERQLKVAVFKIALSLVFLFALVAIALTFLADRGQSITVQLLLVCVGFGFLTNGVLAVLKIIDWFEARKGNSRG